MPENAWTCTRKHPPPTRAAAPRRRAPMPTHNDPANEPGSEHHQMCWTPTPHRQVITGTEHAVTLLATLMSTAEAATLQAHDLRLAEDLYMAAANVECGTMYLHFAKPIIDTYATREEAFEALEDAEYELAGLHQQIVHDAGQFPLDEETIEYLRGHQQALHNLAQLEVIQHILATQGEGMTGWNDTHHEAHVSTAQFLGYQPPFSDRDDLPEPRPGLDRETSAARTKAQEIADTIMNDYTANMPVHLSPAATHLWDPATPPSTGSLSPAFPQFDVLYPEDAGQTGPPVPYMTFIHAQAKYVKTINEPYPKGFPQRLAVEYASAAAQAAMAIATDRNPDAEVESPTDLIVDEMVHIMGDTAKLGLHTATPADLKAIVKSAKDAGLPRGARTTLIQALTDYDSNLADTVLQDPTSTWRKRVTRKQALKSLHAARQNRVDVHTLAELANAMGYDPNELGLHVPNLTKPQFAAIVEAVENAGLPQTAATRIIGALL